MKTLAGASAPARSATSQAACCDSWRTAPCKPSAPKAFEDIQLKQRILCRSRVNVNLIVDRNRFRCKQHFKKPATDQERAEICLAMMAPPKCVGAKQPFPVLHLGAGGDSSALPGKRSPPSWPDSRKRRKTKMPKRRQKDEPKSFSQVAAAAQPLAGQQFKHHGRSEVGT